MSIASNSIITWEDLSNTVVNSIKSCCCNIDDYSSSVPARLKTGTPKATTIWTRTVTNSGYEDSSGIENQPGGRDAFTHTIYAINRPNSERANNLIDKVTSTTVRNEWNAFLESANIKTDSRQNKIIQALELVRVMGLFQQFLSFHIKPVHSRREIFAQGPSLQEAQTVFRGMKYITGTCSPKDTNIGPINPTSIPTVTDQNIYDAVEQSVYRPGVDWGMIEFCSAPSVHQNYVSTSSNG